MAQPTNMPHASGIPNPFRSTNQRVVVCTSGASLNTSVCGMMFRVKFAGTRLSMAEAVHGRQQHPADVTPAKVRFARRLVYEQAKDFRSPVMTRARRPEHASGWTSYRRPLAFRPRPGGLWPYILILPSSPQEANMQGSLGFQHTALQRGL